MEVHEANVSNNLQRNINSLKLLFATFNKNIKLIKTSLFQTYSSVLFSTLLGSLVHTHWLCWLPLVQHVHTVKWTMYGIHFTVYYTSLETRGASVLASLLIHDDNFKVSRCQNAKNAKMPKKKMPKQKINESPNVFHWISKEPLIW